MKNRKLKNYLKIGFLFLGVSFLLINCENNNEESIHLDFENSENLNLKTVSFEDAKNFFNLKIEKIKEEINPNVRKGDYTPLELTPNWNSIEHDDLYGIDQAQLTLADVDINRAGNYISKLFFINRNEKVESVIFTMFPEEIKSDGKIIEAKMIFNELNGDFIDGYRIEGGKITKRITVENKPNVQKASMFMFFQDKVAEWYEECLGGGGVVTNEIVIYGNTNGGGINAGPTSHGIGGLTNLNLYYLNNTYSTGANSGMSGSAGSASATSVAGSLYTQASNVKVLTNEEIERFLNQNVWNEQNPYDDWNKLTDCEKDFFKSNPSAISKAIENRKKAEQAAYNRFNHCKNASGNIDLHNNIGDAYRHAYFSALNTKSMGYGNASKLGDAHECDTPTSQLSEKVMDLKNNSWGYNYSLTNPNLKESQFYQDFIIANNNGEIKILKPCN